jgi:hypothetical protein
MEVTSLECYGDSTKGQCLTEIETEPPLAPNSTIISNKGRYAIHQMSGSRPHHKHKRS